MKCPNCGAEINNESVCGFCGSQITAQMKREQEQLNKPGCPKCGSTNISFSREKNGEIKRKNGTSIVRSTVGLCKDCGYTWHSSVDSAVPKKRKTWLWVLGWIFIFPVPLTILMLRKKEMKPAIKYGIIAAAWIVYLLIGFSGRSNSDESPDSRTLSNSSEQNITEISFLNPQDVTIGVGQKDSSSYVTVEVKNRKDFSPEDVVFVSENPEIATISFAKEALTTYLYYEISGISPGETSVYASSIDGSIMSERIKVTVPKPIEVESVDVEPVVSELVLGKSLSLIVTILPENAEDKSLTWKSSDETVLTVDSKGTVTAVAGGTATITAIAANGLSSSCELNVDGSRRVMNLRVTHSRQDENNIGDDWGYDHQINGEAVTQEFTVSSGDIINCGAQYTEYDDHPDVGQASISYKVTDEDFVNGFTITMDLYVTENGGQNSGKSAHFVVTYTFSLK